ncbi:MAG: peroxiredoxin family protein [Methylococcus sp.]
MRPVYLPAPPLDVSEWFNTPTPLSLDDLQGRIVVLHTFQMLCPGCVTHGLPQAQAVHERFADRGVAVIGLHTVFEHHAAMTPMALEAFIHEYRWSFPIGVDRPSASEPVPHTMRAYQLRGTPSLVVIDRTGRIRQSAFGRVDDLSLGVLLGQLMMEPVNTAAPPPAAREHAQESNACDGEVCARSD